jgi:hypothetical protein
MPEEKAMQSPNISRAAVTYERVLARTPFSPWRPEQVLPDGTDFDFTLPFLPEELAGTRGLTFLSPHERRLVNHIRAHAYLSLFGVVEGFILPFVLERAKAHAVGGDERTRALLQFAGEEAKHMALFERFRATFEHGFGTRCDVVGPLSVITEKVLAHDALGVALVILHIEWMTQRHFVEGVRSDVALEPSFKSLLKHHYMEEAQHAQLDTLLVRELARGRSADEIDAGIDTYLVLGGMIDALLEAQLELDTASLERAIARALSATERATFREAQMRVLRFTFLTSGMTHASFLETVFEIGGERGLSRVRESAKALL